MNHHSLNTRRVVVMVLLALTVQMGAIGFWWFDDRSERATRVVSTVFMIWFVPMCIYVTYDIAGKEPKNLRVLRRSDLRHTRSWFWFLPFLTRNPLNTPEFFRYPPFLIDFQKRYVVERPELDKIKSASNKARRGLLLIEGAPASGKSVLLAGLELKLSRRTWRRIRPRIYVLRLKQLEEDALIDLRQDISFLPRGAVVLVDDVHLYPSMLGMIAQQVRTQSVLLVYSTRPLKNYPQEQTSAIRDMKPDIFSVSASTVADGIVERFIELNFPDVRLFNYQRVYASYKHDLWVLSVALQATTHQSGRLQVSRRAINNWLINNSFRRLHKQGRLINQAQILAPIAALYRFEVACVRSFLENQVGASTQDIQFLLEAGDIVSTTDELFSLHHSTLAELYVNALSQEEGLALVPPPLVQKARTTRLSWQDAAVLWHVESATIRAIRTIVGVARSGDAGRDLAILILHDLDLSCFQESIHHQSTDVETLGTFFALWSDTNKQIDRQTRNALTSYAGAAPMRNPRAWAWAAAGLAKVDDQSAMTFANVLANVMPTVKGSEIADMCTTLSYTSVDVARRALSNLDREITVDSLLKEQIEYKDLARIIAKLVWVDPSFITAGNETLLTLFPNVSAIELPILVSRLAWGHPGIARDLVEKSDIQSLISIVNNSPNRATRYLVFASIANVSQTTAFQIATEEPDILRDKAIHSLYSKLRCYNNSIRSSVHAIHINFPNSEIMEMAIAADAILTAIHRPNRRYLKMELEAIQRSFSVSILLEALVSIPPVDLCNPKSPSFTSWVEDIIELAEIDNATSLAFMRITGLQKEGPS